MFYAQFRRQAASHWLTIDKTRHLTPTWRSSRMSSPGAPGTSRSQPATARVGGNEDLPNAPPTVAALTLLSQFEQLEP